MPLSISSRRLWFISACVSILFLLVIYQLIQLTIIRRPTLLKLAHAQHNLKVDIPPVRGQILDRNGKELAISLKVPSVYAVPRLIGKGQKAPLARELSKILDLKYDFVLERLSRDKAFVWLKRQISFDEAEKIRKMRSAGLGLLDEYRRFYPQGEFLSQVLGFTDIDNRGIEGVELALDAELRGRPGVRHTKRDAMGREIKAYEMKAVPSVDGNKVYLTIDQYYQYLLERSLDAAFIKWKAKGAAAVLMEATTGKILAIANRPTFDPNHYQKSNPETRRNRVITDMYEPGSTFKIVAGSAALNENKVNMETEIFCENGTYRYGSRTLRDVHAYGKLTFPEVLVKSSNIGTVKVAAMLKPETFHSYVKGFGFGRKTGVDLPGEAPGFINPPSKWSKTSPYNIPMGHEVMVNLLQMARSMAVIANGGYLVTPYIISKVEDQKGVVLQYNEPRTGDPVISPETAEKMRGILIRVVEEGTGKKAKINGLAVGGKTGTAQKVLPGGGGYSHSNFMSSFVGFAPADARFVMAVMLDDPKPSYYGGTVAAPVFKEVMEAVVFGSGYIPPNAQIFDPTVSLDEIPEPPPMLIRA